jgi:uncharacterized protein YbjT (DUF2867 family)
MLNRTALIVGATGMVGYELLKKLSNHNRFEKTVSLARKPISLLSASHEHYIIDFDHIESFNQLFYADDLFVCLGTTIKQAGSRRRFKEIDKGYVIKAAKLFLEAGGKRIFLLSAQGANPNSKIFYNRIKGEIEESIKKLTAEECYIFRPSLLLGNRREYRITELLARKAFGLVNLILQPVTKNYVGTQNADLVKAMIQCAINNSIKPGVFSNQKIKKINRDERIE